ncbi:MAG: hypothetical protein AAFZ15_16180 [Bacteroidota bacterium]
MKNSNQSFSQLYHFEQVAIAPQLQEELKGGGIGVEDVNIG